MGYPRRVDLEKALVKAAKSPDPSAALARTVAKADTRPIAVLRVLASLQDGQFATRQARVLGLSPAAIDWLRSSGEAISLARGVSRFVIAPGDPARPSRPGCDVGPMAWSRTAAPLRTTVSMRSRLLRSRRSRSGEV
jgi:hypothetical protein